MTIKTINHSGWLKSLLFIPLLFISEVLSTVIVISLGYDIFNQGSSLNESVMLIQKSFSLVIVLILIWLFMKYIDKQKFIDIGFQTKNRLKDFNYGILIGFIIMCSAYYILLFIGEINYVGYSFNLENIFISIMLFTGVSIFEEVIFRGYVLKNLLESFNPFVALFISSIFFSLIHGANPNVTILGLSNIFLAGFFSRCFLCVYKKLMVSDSFTF